YEGQQVTRLDFRDAIVVTTGNVGERDVGPEYAKLVTRLKTGGIPKDDVGAIMNTLKEKVDTSTFRLKPIEEALISGARLSEDQIQSITDSIVRKAAKTAKQNPNGMPESDPVFPTAWLGRFDKIVGIRAVDISEYQNLLRNKILSWTRTFANISETAGKGRSANFVKVMPSVQLALASIVEADLGKRHLDRLFEQYIIDPLENLLNTEQVGHGDSVIVKLHPDSHIGDAIPRLQFFKIRAPEKHGNQEIVNMASAYYGDGGFREVRKYTPEGPNALQRFKIGAGKFFGKREPVPDEIRNAVEFGGETTEADARQIEAEDRARRKPINPLSITNQ
ncbi:MAG: hypothetical protein K2X47_10720, partial [Bdellovibrionales bacterium]|nr:hypothetical protein [Bdellovibrionales bacterium]